MDDVFMDDFMLLALFLAVAGLVMLLGPMEMIRRYHRRMNKLSDSDLLDDEVRNEGTVLFMVGGIVFLVAALLVVLIKIYGGE